MLNSNKICLWIDTLDHDSVLRPVLGVQKLVFTSSTNKAETIIKKGDVTIAFFEIRFNGYSIFQFKGHIACNSLPFQMEHNHIAFSRFFDQGCKFFG